MTVVFATTGVVLIGLVFATPDFYQHICGGGETGSVCLRNWAGPAAETLTLIALIFAVMQWRESTRQSDSAVRASLVQLREDTASELTRLYEYMGFLTDQESRLTSMFERNQRIERVDDGDTNSGIIGYLRIELQTFWRLRKGLRKLLGIAVLLPIHLSGERHADIRLDRLGKELSEALHDFSATLNELEDIFELGASGYKPLEAYTACDRSLTALANATLHFRKYVGGISEDLQLIAELIATIDRKARSVASRLR